MPDDLYSTIQKSILFLLSLALIASCSKSSEEIEADTIRAHKQQVLNKLGISHTAKFHSLELRDIAGVDVACGIIEATDNRLDRNMQLFISAKSGLVFFEEDMASKEEFQEVWQKFCGDI